MGVKARQGYFLCTCACLAEGFVGSPRASDSIDFLECMRLSHLERIVFVLCCVFEDFAIWEFP